MFSGYAPKTCNAKKPVATSGYPNRVRSNSKIAYARHAGAERMLLMGVLLASEFSGINPYPEIVERAKSDLKIVKQKK